MVDLFAEVSDHTSGEPSGLDAGKIAGDEIDQVDHQHNNNPETQLGGLIAFDDVVDDFFGDVRGDSLGGDHDGGGNQKDGSG